jgi:hypothetical protein
MQQISPSGRRSAPSIYFIQGTFLASRNLQRVAATAERAGKDTHKCLRVASRWKIDVAICISGGKLTGVKFMASHMQLGRKESAREILNTFQRERE